MSHAQQKLLQVTASSQPIVHGKSRQECSADVVDNTRWTCPLKPPQLTPEVTEPHTREAASHRFIRAGVFRASE